MSMKELTIDYLKEIGTRYQLCNDIFEKVRNSGSYNSMPQHKQFALLIQSIITFSSDEQLKKFLNNELLKLNKDDIKKIFNWDRPGLVNYVQSLIKMLDDPFLSFTNTEIQFTFLIAWRLFCEAFRPKPIKEGYYMEIIGYLKTNNFNNKLKSRIAKALIEIDYLDYFNPEDYKKDLFEMAMEI